MNIIKAVTLVIFAFGVAIIAKYTDFRPWVEANSWIGIPMTCFGAAGVCFLFGGRN